MDRYMIIVWLVIAIGTAIWEAAGPALVSIWFTGGAVVALILAAVGAPIWAQVLAFLVVSAVLLAITRPLARKYVNAKKQPTNVDRIIGMPARVTEGIDNRGSRGEVYVDGKHWSARSESGRPIAEGTEVEVLRVEGVKLIVRELEQTAAEK